MDNDKERTMYGCPHAYVTYYDGVYEQCMRCRHLIPIPYVPVPVVEIVEEVVLDDYGCPMVVEEVIVDSGYGYGGYPVVVEEVVVVDPYDFGDTWADTGFDFCE